MKKKTMAIAGTALALAGLATLAAALLWSRRAGTEPIPTRQDWPMWRFDAGRTAASGQRLPARLRLVWVRQFPPPSPAWKDPLNQDRMGYDLCPEPVVAGGTMFVPCAASDKLVALDSVTGGEKWRFYADGPVRLPPAVADGRVYFAGDDGYLYCLSADDGRLRWKFRGGPSELRVLGNERLIGAWPARGGPVVADGVVSFAAGIWPFMGVFLHALDADSGRVIWTNDGCSFDFIDQPHNSPAFAGPAPQGPLTVAGDKLLVPTGRAVPACFDRRSGQLLYYHLAAVGKSGGARVSALGDWFFNWRQTGADMFELAGGSRLSGLDRLGPWPVLTEQALYFAGGAITALDPASVRRIKFTRQLWDAAAGRKVSTPAVRHEMATLWRCDADVGATNASADAPRRDYGPLIKAADRLYAAAGDTIIAIDLPRGGRGKPVRRQVAKVEGTIGQLLAADNKLFAVTADGSIYAFGAPAPAKPARYPFAEVEPRRDDEFARRVLRLLRDTRINGGYCLLLGRTHVRLLEELASRTQFNLILIDPDESRVAAVRRRMDELGLYGRRVAALAGDPMTFALPPYLASMTIVDDADSAGLDERRAEAFLAKLYRSMRPYGGLAWLTVSPAQARLLRATAESAALPGADLKLVDGVAMLSRKGPLPGSASWTHQYGDPANTVCSADGLVKAPLGMLWFGGPSHMDVLPRHGHGPPEQVVAGRLFIQGTDSISARDVYTGRLLWKTPIENLGTFGFYYDESYNPDPLAAGYNQEHIPGANARGSNFVATADAVYVLQKRACLKLDAASGQVRTRFTFPGASEGDVSRLGTPADAKAGLPKAPQTRPDASGADAPEDDVSPLETPTKSDESPLPTPGEPGQWGFLAIDGDLMIAGAHPLRLPPDIRRNMDIGRSVDARAAKLLAFDGTASRTLMVRDRNDGRILWSVTAEQGFRHNAIAVGGGRLFCIDVLPPLVRDGLHRRGAGIGDRAAGSGEPTPSVAGPARLLAFDLRTGKELWRRTDPVFGSWLSYSAEHDLLLQAGRHSSDMLLGEVADRMAVHRAADGSALWDRSYKDYRGPLMLHGRTIIAQDAAYELFTGSAKTRSHPLTGQKVPWKFTRNYGCGTAIASEHLLTFRSAAAGFYDLAADSGTGNLGGFRSGCTSNLIPADGVLNAPDYTRTCTCSYPNQTSLALVHMPDLEFWTFSALPKPVGRVRRLGLNLGAPGDRQANDGTLWLDWPSVGGPSPDLPVRSEPNKPRGFRRHSSNVRGGQGPSWVLASGLEGVRRLTVPLYVLPPGATPWWQADTQPDPPAPVTPAAYTVRLFFAEMGDAAPGQRVFDVWLQDRKVLENFDPVAEAAGPWRGVVRQFDQVAVERELTIRLAPAGSAPQCEPILCGVEIAVSDE